MATEIFSNKNFVTVYTEHDDFLAQDGAVRIRIGRGVLCSEAIDYLAHAIAVIGMLKVLPTTEAERMVGDLDTSDLPPKTGDEKPADDEGSEPTMPM
jgi:hypothetical protein